MFWEVSNYNLWPMEKINFYILSFLLFLTSFSNSQDYEYDDYNYNENYDYTDDYSQELNDYYGLAPTPSPILPPFIPSPPPRMPQPPPPKPGNYIIVCWLLVNCYLYCCDKICRKWNMLQKKEIIHVIFDSLSCQIIQI